MDTATVTSTEAPLMFAMADGSVQLATVYEKDLVEVVERINELWVKVKYHDEIGYIRAKHLTGENFDDAETVAIEIPKDSAAALYRALKLTLSK